MVVELNTYLLILGVFAIACIVGWLISGRSRIFLDVSVYFLLAMASLFFALISIEDGSTNSATGIALSAVFILIIALRVRVVYTHPIAKMRHELEIMRDNKNFSDQSSLAFASGHDHLKKLFDSNRETLAILVEAIDQMSKYEKQTVGIAETITKLSDRIENDTETLINDIDENLRSTVLSNQISENIQNKVKDLTEDFMKFNHQMIKAINTADILSDQTNLVAVNAAIEAANSDKESDNFALVADGIQRLSSRSKETAIKLSRINNSLTQMINNKLNAINLEFSNLDNSILQIAELSDKASALGNKQKSVNVELKSQLFALHEKRIVLLKAQDEFNY